MHGSRFILICHMTVVEQMFIRLSNINNLVLDFGKWFPLQFGIIIIIIIIFISQG